MPAKSKYVLSLEGLGFKPLSTTIGAEAAVERERFWKEVEKSLTKGMNRAQRRRWKKLGKEPRFAQLGGVTFASDDTGAHWILEDKVDLRPHGFVDILGYFQDNAQTFFPIPSRLH